MADVGVVTKKGTPLSHHDILYILQNETYRGDKRLQKQAPRDFLTKRPDETQEYESYYLEDDHEAIVDAETWDAVQERIKRNQDLMETVGHLGGRPHFMYGKVFCSDCGSPMTRRTFTGYRGVKYKAWVCRDRQLGRKWNGCKMRTVREGELLDEIKEQTGFDVSAETAGQIDRVEVMGDCVKVEVYVAKGA